MEHGSGARSRSGSGSSVGAGALWERELNQETPEVARQTLNPGVVEDILCSFARQSGGILSLKMLALEVMFDAIARDDLAVSAEETVVFKEAVGAVWRDFHKTIMNAGLGKCQLKHLAKAVQIYSYIIANVKVEGGGEVDPEAPMLTPQGALREFMTQLTNCVQYLAINATSGRIRYSVATDVEGEKIDHVIPGYGGAGESDPYGALRICWVLMDIERLIGHEDGDVRYKAQSALDFLVRCRRVELTGARYEQLLPLVARWIEDYYPYVRSAAQITLIKLKKRFGMHQGRVMIEEGMRELRHNRTHSIRKIMLGYTKAYPDVFTGGFFFYGFIAVFEFFIVIFMIKSRYT